MADHALQIAFYLLVAHPQHPVAIFSQLVPQDHLGRCHLLSQLPGALAGFVEAGYSWHNPIIALIFNPSTIHMVRSLPLLNLGEGGPGWVREVWVSLG
jgi:hypothetical protein